MRGVAFSSTKLSVSQGNIFNGELDLILQPSHSSSPKRGIIYVHGAEGIGGGGNEWQKYNERSKLLTSLAWAGHTVISADLGGNATWGNDTVLSRITAAKNYLLTLGVLPTKIVLLGTSMGALSALNWAAENPSSTACVAGIIPVVDLTDVHANNRWGYQPAINAAYGGSYSEAAFGAAHNPATMAAAGKYAGIPIKLWYGSTDGIAIPSAVTAFKASAGSLCTATPVAGGHAESTYGLIDISNLLAFINEV